MNTEYGFQISNTRFLIPKMHVYAHNQDCIREFHPERHPIVGFVDGECCERNWSEFSKVQTIVTRQTSDNRTLQLQDIFWNKSKRADTIEFIQTLMRKRDNYKSQVADLEEAFYQFNTVGLSRTAFQSYAWDLRNRELARLRNGYVGRGLTPLQKIDRKLAFTLKSIQKLKSMYWSSAIPGKIRSYPDLN